MRKNFDIQVSEVIPSLTSVLELQGIPKRKQPDERTVKLAEEAIKRYEATAQPKGILLQVSQEEFTSVFEGKEKNSPDAPLGPIYRTADSLALFVVTVGQEISNEISNLFTQNDFAHGSMLDSAASEGAESTAQYIENFYRAYLIQEGKFNKESGILRFSPGYCGWNISAQAKLFEKINPAEIGVTLNKSYLMQPLKSISGVIVAGQKNIFQFDDTFSFCEDCTTHSCRERIKTIY